MAKPFHQTRHLLRQNLLSALGLASVAVTPACARTNTPGEPGADGRQGASGDAGARMPSTELDATSQQPAAPLDAGNAATVSETDADAGDSGPPMCRPRNAGELAKPAQVACFDREQMKWLGMYGFNQIIGSPPSRTEEVVAAAFLDNGCLPPNMVTDDGCRSSIADGVPQDDGTCCYYFCSIFPKACGRPLVIDGRAHIASVISRSDWNGKEHVTDSHVPDDLQERVAGEWLQDGCMEHASIASFARFTQQLLVLGAPAELLHEATRAAADEVRHAELCFGLAARHGASGRGPGALPEAASPVMTDAVEACIAAFVEGGIEETLAAHQAALQAECANDVAAKAALHSIAADEARHGELAWRFVQWVARRHPEVLPALQAQLSLALARADAQCAASERETEATLDVLHAAGRLTSHERHLARRVALREVVAPCLAALVRDCAACQVA